MAWQREYKTRGVGCAAIFVSLVLGFIGLIFMLLFGVAIGALIIAGGIGAFFLIRYFSQSVTITCWDQGFRVQTQSQKNGISDTTYSWAEVTSTNYWERRAGRDGNTTRHFAVETARGPAFQVTSGISNFADLIELFNQMAPQVPYVWKPHTGFSIQLGPLSASRGAYVSVPREQIGNQ